jgi:hypothetical protein
MRPLDKGFTPTTDDGDEIEQHDYANWRASLVSRIGYYCSYCNTPLSHTLNVEHVVPKNPPPGYEAGDPVGWDNMLLACVPCNNTKGNQPIAFKDYYFPEEHNTLIPFQIVLHSEVAGAAIVQIQDNLNEVQKVKAQSSINLLGLDQLDLRERVVDLRWKKRFDAITAVESAYYLFNIAKNNHPKEIEKIARMISYLAKPAGFFSLWFDQFKDEPSVIKALIENIPGTATTCFDSENNYHPTPRNPENNTDPI